MTFIELFAGIGGFSLGFERAGMECVGHCEIDPYAQKVLLKHWPDVPLWQDVTKLQPEEIGKVDLIAGGFPCQDLSVAGKQGGIHGARSGLYDEIIRLCRALRPRYIVLENVANLLSRPDWFGYVLGRLAEIGYDAEWEIISAANVGAPHLRKRIWIVAYPTIERWEAGTIIRGKIPKTLGGSEFDKRGSTQKKNVANPNKKRLSAQWVKKRLSKKSREACSSLERASSLGTKRKSDWWDIEPQLGRMADGIPKRMDRLKCLGNALVPQIAEFIGNQIMELEDI